MRQAPLFIIRNNYVQPYSSPNPSFDNQIPTQDDEVDEDNSNDYSSDWNEEVQGRVRVPFRVLKNQVVPVDKEGRFFFFSNSNSLNSFNLLSFLRTSTSTTTILATVTSTLTSASVLTCAAASQFIATTACRRRRYAEIIDTIQEDPATIISPSKVESMEFSAPPRQIRHIDNTNSASSAEIESSQNFKDEETDLNRSKRSFFRKSIILTSSSTLTITTFSITTSTVTKSVTLGIGGCQSCVSCLPSGVTIC